MFLISLALILLTFDWTECWHTRPPERFSNKKHAEYAIIQRLHFLNMLITKDVFLKLRHAEKLQERYKGSLNYELGTLAAGLLDTFKHMVEVYRTYSNSTELVLNNIPVDEYFDAYHVIQSDYNEILLESDMYYGILNKYIAIQEHEKWVAKQRSQSKFDKFRTKTTAQVTEPMPSARRSKAEEDFKQKLRRNKWLKKWNNFVPEIEGVDIDLDFPNA